MKNQTLPAWRRPRILFVAVALLLTLLALCIRLYQIDSVPAGLFYDEAVEGLDAYALSGLPFWRWPIFFTAINGREPLYVYLVHAAQTIWGPTIVAVRVVSATAGALMTPALIWLAWELAPFLNVRNRHRFALWAGASSLALLWPQMISRLGQRISLFGLFEVLVFAALWHAISRSAKHAKTQAPPNSYLRLISWLLVGVLAGLAFYTYLAVRILPFVLLPPAAVWWLRRQGARVPRWGIVIAVGAALLTAAPLLLHFARHPDHLNLRTGQISVLDQGWPTLWANVKAVLGMAFVGGDINFRLNLPERSVFDPVTLLLFAMGLWIAARRLWRPAQLFLLAGLGIMLLPTLLSEQAPNYGRAFGAFPFAVILIALGLEWGLERVNQRFPAAELWPTAAGVLLLTASVVLTLRIYFVDWANHPDAFAAWNTGYTAIAEDIRSSDQHGGAEVVYAGPGVADKPTVAYLLADLDPAQSPRGFDGDLCLRVDTDQAASYYVLPQRTPRGAALLKDYLPDSRAQATITDGEGNIWAERIDQPTGGAVVFDEMTAQTILLGDGIALRGYWVDEGRLTPGATFYTRLFWDVAQAPSENYTAFVQLLNRTADGVWQRIAGADRPPGNGSCPTGSWVVGEVVIDELQFTVPGNLPAGDLYLAVGFYNADGVRLHVPGNGDD
ncbi:MAG: hypothetical protein KDD84_17140, partial [Caldilineaceae bacterium]|nr:hypothetical protein [Caldilineaceae bacterium]